MKKAILFLFFLSIFIASSFVASHALAVDFLKDPITTSQDLSSAALSYTTSTGRTFKLDEVTLQYDASATETITITRDSRTGAAYDVVLAAETIASATSFVFRPQGECNFFAGDEVKVQSTNNGTANVYVEIRTSEIN